MKRWIALPLFLLANAAFADAAHDVTAVDPYVRGMPPGQQTTATFMVLKNSGTEPHKLVKASSPAAKVVELHNHVNEGGVMKMRPVADIPIPAHGETRLQPGGLHVMLIDVGQTLKDGEAVDVTLSFEDGSNKVVKAPVKKPGGEMSQPMGHHHGM